MKGFEAKIVRGVLVIRVPIAVEKAEAPAGGLPARARELMQEEYLTGRELDVFRGIRRRLANKEIAAELRISERTVKYHVSSLLAKLRCTTRAELQFKFGYDEEEK